MRNHSVSKQTIRRLPTYLSFLKDVQKKNIKNISAVTIAEAMKLNEVQVRKDLASVSKGGKPKIGYVINSLITELENFLGYDTTDYAVLVGAGNLGSALTGYKGFDEFGLEIIAAFDNCEDVVGKEIRGKPVYPISKLPEVCREHDIKIGIITVPGAAAQEVCDELINAGIKAIWNFASVHLSVPEGVLVQNENMAYSLAALSLHLAEQMQKIEEEKKEK